MQMSQGNLCWSEVSWVDNSDVVVGQIQYFNVRVVNGTCFHVSKNVMNNFLMILSIVFRVFFSFVCVWLEIDGY